MKIYDTICVDRSRGLQILIEDASREEAEAWWQSKGYTYYCEWKMEKKEFITFRDPEGHFQKFMYIAKALYSWELDYMKVSTNDHRVSTIDHRPSIKD